MAQAMGQNARIGFQLESQFKQDPTTPDVKILPFARESVQLTRDLISSNTLRATRNSARPVLGNKIIKGSIHLELQANIGTWFKAALGSVNTTGTGPYTHTFKIGELPSLLIEKAFTDTGEYYKYNGCLINKMNLNVKPEGFQELVFDIVAAKETISTFPFDSTPTELSFVPFTGFEAAIEEGGSPILIVTEFNLTLENNLNYEYVIGGGGEIYSLRAGKAKVSGNIRVLYENKTLYEKAKNSTDSSLKVKFIRGTGTGSEGNEYLEIYIPKLKYLPATPIADGDKGILIELPFEGFTDSIDESSIVITLKNMQETV